MIVVDASVVVAALVGEGAVGTWAARSLAGEQLVAPHLMPVEAASTLRRETLSRRVSVTQATLAHRAVVDLGTTLLDYAPYAERIWELRPNVTANDAWYVAVAEALGCSLVTLDRRLARAAGPRCRFATPPD